MNEVTQPRLKQLNKEQNYAITRYEEHQGHSAEKLSNFVDFDNLLLNKRLQSKYLRDIQENKGPGMFHKSQDTLKS